jgi:hypothetical protein
MSNAVQQSLAQAAIADVHIAVRLNHKLDTTQLDQGDILDEARHTCVIQELSAAENMTFHNANEVIKASEPDGGYKYDAKNVQKLWPESVNNKYIDPVSGKIIPPKSSVDAANREDASMWLRAYEIENNGLDKLGCFQYGPSLDDLRKMGYTHKPVPQLVLYEAKTPNMIPRVILQRQNVEFVYKGTDMLVDQGFTSIKPLRLPQKMLPCDYSKH